MLGARPEPRPLRIKNRKDNEAYTGETLHAMHSSGGYELLNYTRRNWQVCLTWLEL
jgi:hypothetical protein